MSSWKKASKANQKIHRERHQPESRAHLGLLEKKKDYIRRAKDFHQKEKVLKKLKRHALDRNPDEFYYHMINSKLKDGKHVEKKAPESEDTKQQMLLMENKSINYVNMKRTIERKKIDRLQAGLHLVDIASNMSSRRHVKFDADGNELPVDESHESSSERQREQIAKMPLHKIDEKAIERLHKLKMIEYNKLARRIDRHKQLSIIQEKMEVQRALKKPSYEKPKLVKQGTKDEAPIYKWKYERKR
ncbi:probable U3 small nucleolar RNA-associated protein 11 [Cimex lectularius]|uniref:U3 small nucleolar RNA-associated protein 11 n=1 Tax=Cimex lectularius TaxID=79782 RepID=A0A8I6REP0_CIMLE|nr:probable U3 small nucleolar RNA-associated protein 11 [Cimex lectularius]